MQKPKGSKLSPSSESLWIRGRRNLEGLVCLSPFHTKKVKVTWSESAEDKRLDGDHHWWFTVIPKGLKISSWNAFSESKLSCSKCVFTNTVKLTESISLIFGQFLFCQNNESVLHGHDPSCSMIVLDIRTRCWKPPQKILSVLSATPNRLQIVLSATGDNQKLNELWEQPKGN